MWQIETYNRTTRRWQAYRAPSADFAALYKKVTSLQETGHKARIVKLSGPETQEQKQPAGETTEDKARQLGCTFSAPFDCEYCNRKSCPVTVENIRRAQEETAK